MARGGGNITYVPRDERPYVPSFLEILLQAAPQFLQAYTQGQMLNQQKALTAAQLATAQAQGTAANLEVGQMQAGQQANIEAARALIGQGEQAAQNYVLPTPQLPTQSMQTPGGTPVAGVTGPIRTTRPQPTLPSEYTEFLANPANRAVVSAVRKGQISPELDARLALAGQDATRLKQRGNQRRALGQFRAQLAKDPNSQDLLPRVDAFATLLDSSGSFSYDEARSAAQMLGLPQTRAEQLATLHAQAQVDGMRDERAAATFASDALRQRFPTTFGTMPEGTFMPGAHETLRTLTVLDTQFSQNIGLQENAHTNALKLEAERAKNEFNNLFTKEMISLTGALARPVEQADGSLLYPNAQQIAGHVNAIASQYGVTLPQAQMESLTGAINEATLMETAVGAFNDALATMSYADAQAKLRDELARFPNMTSAQQRQIFGQVMTRVPRTQTRGSQARPLTLPADAAAGVGGVASPMRFQPTPGVTPTSFTDPLQFLFQTPQ